MVAHDHSHGRDAHPHAPDRGREGRSLAWAMALTGVVMLVEAAGGFYARSLSLLSDAGHMLTDLSALLLSALALRLGSRPADLRRTYGYYRLEILAALFNGSLLIVLAGFIVYEAIERLGAQTPVRATPMLIVAAIGFVANLGGLWLLSHAKTLNVRAAFLHVLSDTVSSVGVILAGVGILFTGWYFLDPAVSLVIAVLIVIGAVGLVREAVEVLLEAVPAHMDLAEVLHAMEREAGVSRVHDLHIWTLSSGVYALSAHVVVREESVGRNDQILSCIQSMLLDRFHVAHATLQIESESYSHIGEVH